MKLAPLIVIVTVGEPAAMSAGDTELTVGAGTTFRHEHFDMPPSGLVRVTMRSPSGAVELTDTVC